MRSGARAATAKAPVAIKSKWTCDLVINEMMNPAKFIEAKMAVEVTNGCLL